MKLLNYPSSSFIFFSCLSPSSTFHPTQIAQIQNKFNNSKMVTFEDRMVFLNKWKIDNYQKKKRKWITYSSLSRVRGEPKMELALCNHVSFSVTRGIKGLKLQVHRRKVLGISSALPETAISVAVAATVVGAAATLLVKRTQDSEKSKTPVRICEACSGSGICPECKGEGFVVQKLSEETAERGRMTSSTAATRYTSGLPRKWSYCSKCTSSRSCITCDGTGKLSC